MLLLYLQAPRSRTSIASDADNERVFSPQPTGLQGHINDAYDAASDTYDRSSHISSSRHSRTAEENVIYNPWCW